MKKISNNEIQKIQELFRQGYSVRAIAKISGRSPNTVLRYKPPLPQQHNQQTPPQTAQMSHFDRRYKYGEKQPVTHNYPPAEPFPPIRSPNTNYDSEAPVPHRSENNDLLKEIAEELRHRRQRDRFEEEQKEREKKEQEKKKLEAQNQAKKATPRKSPQTDTEEPELTYHDAKNIVHKEVTDYYHNSVKNFERYSNNKIHHLRELDKLNEIADYRDAIAQGYPKISEPLIYYGIRKLIKGWNTPIKKNIYHKVYLEPARDDTDIKMGIPIAKVIEWKPSCSRKFTEKKDQG